MAAKTKQGKTTSRPPLEKKVADAVEAPSLGLCPRLLAAADNFITVNTGFESSTVGEIIRSELETAPDLNKAALVPVRHKVLSFEAALKWAFFLYTAPAKIIQDEGDAAPPALRDPEAWPPFDVARFLTEIGKIYDLAVDTVVWDHCDADDSDDSDDDGGDDDGED